MVGVPIFATTVDLDGAGQLAAAESDPPHLLDVVATLGRRRHDAGLTARRPAGTITRRWEATL